MNPTGHVTLTMNGDFGPLIEEGGIDELLDLITDNLMVCAEVVDPAVSFSADEADGTAGTMEFEFFIDGDKPEKLVETAMVALRTAFHSAELATPGWESAIDSMIDCVLTKKVENNGLVPA